MLAAIATVRNRHAPLNTPCCICGQPIDYTLPGTDDLGMSVEHIKARSTHPHLTWDPGNWAPAHLGCNRAKGNRSPVEIGAASRAW